MRLGDGALGEEPGVLVRLCWLVGEPSELCRLLRPKEVAWRTSRIAVGLDGGAAPSTRTGRTAVRGVQLARWRSALWVGAAIVEGSLQPAVARLH